jgi:Tol biopolymer transport system component
VTPLRDTLIVRDGLQLTATPRDSAGHALNGRAVTWSSADTAIVQVSSLGFASARGVGSVAITATSEGKTGAATIVSRPLVTFSPRLPSLFLGDTTQLAGHLFDLFNGSLPGHVSGWVSATPSVASVSASGVVTGLSAGAATLTASAGATTASVEVVVLAPRIGSNRMIAFLQDTLTALGILSQLKTMNANGSGVMTLTPYPFSVWEFDWSPDGSRIALVVALPNNLGTSLSLWVLNADGSGLDSLGPSGLYVRWSPDGSTLAFRDFTNPNSIATIRADGSGYHQVSSVSGDALNPEWSPDGRQIAFWRQTTHCDDLWIMDADGGNQHHVAVPAPVCGLRWRPDGKEILFWGQSALPGSLPGIWLVRPDGTGFHPLALDCGAGCPAGLDTLSGTWSADGTRILFPGTGAGNIALANRDGTGLVQIALSQPCCSPIEPYPDWSPDGMRLVFTTRDTAAVQGPSIGVINQDGSMQQQLTTGRASGAPKWQP